MSYRDKNPPQVGTRFGSWVFLGEYKREGEGRRIRKYLLCRCDCGTERFVLYNGLLHNKSKNCGCQKHVARRRGLTSKELEQDRTLRYKYGISLADKRLLIQLQEGRCAVCKCKTKDLNVDHCHKTNRVRGLLCTTCNQGIGMFLDNPVFLTAAAKYLLDTSIHDFPHIESL